MRTNQYRWICGKEAVIGVGTKYRRPRRCRRHDVTTRCCVVPIPSRKNHTLPLEFFHGHKPPSRVRSRCRHHGSSLFFPALCTCRLLSLSLTLSLSSTALTMTSASASDAPRHDLRPPTLKRKQISQIPPPGKCIGLKRLVRAHGIGVGIGREFDPSTSVFSVEDDAQGSRGGGCGRIGVGVVGGVDVAPSASGGVDAVVSDASSVKGGGCCTGVGIGSIYVTTTTTVSGGCNYHAHASQEGFHLRSQGRHGRGWPRIRWRAMGEFWVSCRT
mmetsp:Transcript_24084/g.49293  ORF Transcript_24084/g.49293 Transcript_24084/m.49293 type:complete len:272 (+) Transcript_24084:912-1727(+)